MVKTQRINTSHKFSIVLLYRKEKVFKKLSRHYDDNLINLIYSA